MMIRLSLGAAAALFIANSPASAQMVVIESSEPSLAIGATLAAKDSVRIAENGRVVLVAPTGRMVSLKGPYSGALPSDEAKPDGRLAAALTSLVKRKGDETGSVGAVRAMGANSRIEQVKDAADVLTIDVASEGTVCVYEPGAKRLARNRMSPVEKLV